MIKEIIAWMVVVMVLMVLCVFIGWIVQIIIYVAIFYFIRRYLV